MPKSLLAFLNQPRPKPSIRYPNQDGMTPLENEPGARAILKMHPIQDWPSANANDDAFSAKDVKVFDRAANRFGHSYDPKAFNAQPEGHPLRNPNLNVLTQTEAFAAVDSVGLGSLVDYRVVNIRTGEYVTKKMHKEEAIELAAKLNNEYLTQLDESVTRKHFREVANTVRSIEDPAKRQEFADHHANIFASQNPRFDHARFHAAAGTKTHEERAISEENLDEGKIRFKGKTIGKFKKDEHGNLSGYTRFQKKGTLERSIEKGHHTLYGSKKEARKDMKRQYKDFKKYGEETQLESTPPGKGFEHWVHGRKADFKKRYGDRWERVLYATAWKMKKKHPGGISSEGVNYLGDVIDNWVDRAVSRVDEISKAKLGRYVKGAAGEIGVHSADSGRAAVYSDQLERSRTGKHKKGEYWDRAVKGFGKASQRHVGISYAIDKMTGKSKVKATEETQIDEAKKGVSWNPPEVQAKAAKEKKERRMFASAKREINRLKKKGK